jgi:hypothetical protein
MINNKQSGVDYIEEKIKQMIAHGSDFGDDLPALLEHIKQAKVMCENKIKISTHDLPEEYQQIITENFNDLTI